MTPAQRAELEWIVTLRLAASYVRHGFPGHPAGNLDMRSVAALERRGLFESVVHRYTPKDTSIPEPERTILLYRATEAGRAIITNASTDANAG